MATSILSGVFGFFLPAPKKPAAFRSGRPAATRNITPSPTPVTEYIPAAPAPAPRKNAHRWLLVEFGTSPEAKRFKRVVQDALTGTIEHCSAMTTAYTKSNGRAVLIDFCAANYATEAVDSAFRHFTATLDIFGMNAGGLAFQTPDATSRTTAWRDCAWREVVAPAHHDGAIVGYVLASDVGMRII